MKIKFTLYILISALFINLISCASKEPAPPRERDETFIADVNPFVVDSFHLYTTKGINKPTISDFTVYFAPRTNYVLLSTKIGVNFVRIDFSYEERKALNEAKEIYLTALNEGTIPNEKPKKKNAYSTGEIQVSWGVAGLTHFVNTTYTTHAYYLESGKPYFRFSVAPVEEVEGEHVYSPSFCIYISPAQWETIVQACSQENLVAMTDQILTEANEF